jgi:hypothetical protein
MKKLFVFSALVISTIFAFFMPADAALSLCVLPALPVPFIDAVRSPKNLKNRFAARWQSSDGLFLGIVQLEDGTPKVVISDTIKKGVYKGCQATSIFVEALKVIGKDTNGEYITKSEGVQPLLISESDLNLYTGERLYIKVSKGNANLIGETTFESSLEFDTTEAAPEATETPEALQAAKDAKIATLSKPAANASAAVKTAYTKKVTAITNATTIEEVELV